MFEVRKTFELAGAHQLNLDRDSKCNQLHGHNWMVTVCCRSDVVGTDGMVIDFIEIKKAFKKEVHAKLDHANLNAYFGQPTAENIAKWVYEHLQHEIGARVFRVEVVESRDNMAAYEE